MNKVIMESELSSNNKKLYKKPIDVNKNIDENYKKSIKQLKIEDY